MSLGIIKMKMPTKMVFNRSTNLILLVFVLIFVSNDTFMFGTNSISMMVEIPRILMGVYIAYELLRLIKNRAKINRVIQLGLIMSALMVVISMYHGDSIKLIIIKCLCIMSAALLAVHYSFEEYAKAFTNVVVFLCVMALVLEGASYILPGIVNALPRVVNTAGLEIATIGLAGMDANELTENIIRSYGIFWEPGVFQMYLNLALIFELFVSKPIKWRSVVILLVGVFTTFSTTGYVVSAWILVTYFFFEQQKVFSQKNLVIASLLFSGLIVALIAFDFSIINELVFGKLGDSENGNWIARSASIVVNLDIFFDYPLFGVGMDQINEEMVSRSALFFARSTRHNTNTLLYQFAAHGIFYGGLFAFGTLKFPKCLSSKKSVIVAMVVSLILMYVGENLRYSMFPLILIFYGYQAKRPVNTALQSKGELHANTRH